MLGGNSLFHLQCLALYLFTRPPCSIHQVMKLPLSVQHSFILFLNLTLSVYQKKCFMTQLSSKNCSYNRQFWKTLPRRVESTEYRGFSCWTQFGMKKLQCLLHCVYSLCLLWLIDLNTLFPSRVISDSRTRYFSVSSRICSSILKTQF